MSQGCIYCGEPRGEKMGCCGENHWEDALEEECGHELKLTGMYEPFSVACGKCGSLHFSEDEFDAQQAKIGGMPYGTYGHGE